MRNNNEYRSDKGGRHTSGIWGNGIIRQYKLNGEFVAEYTSIADAVDALTKQGIAVRYSGIWSCLTGRQKKAHGFIWKSTDGYGTGRIKTETNDSGRE